jgi:hypothetical protein
MAYTILSPATPTATQVAYKGPVDLVLLDFFGGLRSACTCAQHVHMLNTRTPHTRVYASQ